MVRGITPFLNVSSENSSGVHLKATLSGSGSKPTTANIFPPHGTRDPFPIECLLLRQETKDIPCEWTQNS